MTRELIGYRKDGSPIYVHFGAEDDDFDGDESDESDEDEDDEGDDEDESDDDEDEDSEEDGDDGGDYVPPTREQWDNIRSAIRRNNQENKRHRLLATKLRGLGIDPNTPEGEQALERLVAEGTPGDGGPARKSDVSRAVNRAVAATEEKYKAALARSTVKAELTDAGWLGSNLDRVMSMIDLEDVSIDETGNVTGIAEQVADIKADIPHWFRTGAKDGRPRRSGVAEVDGGNKRTKPSGSNGTWLDKVDKQITG